MRGAIFEKTKNQLRDLSWLLIVAFSLFILRLARFFCAHGLLPEVRSGAGPVLTAIILVVSKYFFFEESVLGTNLQGGLLIFIRIAFCHLLFLIAQSLAHTGPITFTFSIKQVHHIPKLSSELLCQLFGCFFYPGGLFFLPGCLILFPE